MRARFVVTSALAGASLAACGIDLFHSTDFDDACVADPTTAGCVQPDGAVADGMKPQDGTIDDGVSADGFVAPGDAGDASDTSDTNRPDTAPPPPTDFCQWSSSTARDKANRACAWLGACATGFGANDFGQCVDDAVRAYNCNVDPSRKVAGDAHKYWDCLWKVKTCADVLACMGPAATCTPQGLEYGACSGSLGLDCPAAGGKAVGLQPCIGEGKVCNLATNKLACGGTSAACSGGAAACTGTGTAITDCSAGAGVDQGIDCKLYGSICQPYASGAACQVLNDGGACTPTGTVTCGANAVVQGCPSGSLETVQCNELLEGTAGCDFTQPGPLWDMTRGCVANGAACAPGCSADGGLIACQRQKHRIEIACGAYGLGPCQTGQSLSATTYQCKAP
jgi:hypothetical protein